MSTYGLFEPTLRDILRLINPSREDWAIRFRIIEELRAVVQNVECLRGATVEPYGSFASNLFTRWGDLDISIEIHNGSYISSPGKKHKQSLLGDVLRALTMKGGWRKLHIVANARVPILNFQSNYQNISCHISINNLSSQMKCKILFWINEIDGRFRDMVKEWAKAQQTVNDAKSGNLNSYALSLLVIFHFQTCVPAILPPLKEIYPGNMVYDLTGMRAVAEKQIEETCALNINRFRSESRRINRSSLSELFISFLAKFSDINLKASEQGISPYSGQWENIESNTTWQPKTYALFVEDPFEQPANSARSVSSRQLARLAEAFQTTHQMLMSANQNQSSLIAMLVRQEISYMVEPTPVRNPGNYSANYLRTRPQVHRAVNSPAQVQQQSQNTKVDRRTNNVISNSPQMHRAVNSPAQVQQQSQNTKVGRRNVTSNSPQVYRAVNSPAQVQQQSQNAKVDRCTNNVTPKEPVRAYHSQGQQMWRPKSNG